MTNVEMTDLIDQQGGEVERVGIYALPGEAAGGHQRGKGGRFIFFIEKTYV